MKLVEKIRQASQLIAEASALWIGAGAGMGVDSGLPDFRGNEGFWNAYPPYRHLGLSFYDLANPYWFERNPRQAWGFYGHRLNLYRDTPPHTGFSTMLKWADQKAKKYFVFTSNVDGHFQRAGFDDQRVVECHGSIQFLQCSTACHQEIWKVSANPIAVDESTMLADQPLPHCRRCQNPARPNILMFGDAGWLSGRTNLQVQRYSAWLREAPGDLVKIEFGAGTAVPTVRYEAQRLPGTLIRVNPRECETAEPDLSIDCGALEFIQRVDACVRRVG